MDMSDYDSLWYAWQQIQARHRSNIEAGAQDRAGTYSPQYCPTMPPSASPAPDPVTPLVQTGPSAVGSASFDIRSLWSSTKKDPSSPRRVSVIAASPSNSTEMQVDLPEVSSTDALPIAETLDDPPPRVRS
jgi:hypothetical protein